MDRVRWRRWTVVAVVVGLLTACGGGAAEPTISSSAGDGATGGESSLASETSTDGGEATDEGFAWAPWGPADPGDPPPNQWYGLLERHDCGGMEAAGVDQPGQELWAALAAVCAAVVDGDQSAWAAAVDAADRLGPGGDGSPACLEGAARALLVRALEWHERHPDRQPAVRFPAPGSETACDFRIDGIRVVALDDGFWRPTGEPLEGPVTGGTLLELAGSGIDQPTRVDVAGRPAEVVSSVEVGVIVRTPPVEEPLTAEIRLYNRAGEVVSPSTFRYVATPTASPTPTLSPETATASA